MLEKVKDARYAVASLAAPQSIKVQSLDVLEQSLKRRYLTAGALAIRLTSKTSS